jgi:hypothetical protein
MRRFPTKARAFGLVCLLVLLGASINGAPAGGSSFSFPLVVSGGAATCLPNAAGVATISPMGAVETLTLQVTGLPPKTGFDFFIIQVPTAPFGLTWYQGDLETNALGNGVGTFVGRFSIETFIVAPGVAPAPTPFPKGPFPDANSNPATNPVQLYHLGLWFDSTKAAGKAGCPTTATPFNGKHKAGIQVLNTNNFPQLAGPLINVK